MHPLLERAMREGTPLVDGEACTFVWEGAHAPPLLGDFNYWGRLGAAELREIAPGVWAYSLTLLRDAYIEYAFERDGVRLIDPNNTRLTFGGVDRDNHYFAMPDFMPTPLIEVGRGLKRGTVTPYYVEGGPTVIGERRRVHLYHPPVSEPAPLLVVFDGQDYLWRARLAHIVDNLIAQGRIRPIAMALVEHGAQARFAEYACSEATLGFVLRFVLPLARQRLNLIETPGAHGLLGASMGGLTALYTALRAPHIFGHVISQSGAFTMPDFHHEFPIYEMLEHFPTRPITIWMDVGLYEHFLPSNQRMAALLRARGYAVTYREYAGGHNYTAWQNEVWRALEAIFGQAGHHSDSN